MPNKTMLNPPANQIVQQLRALEEMLYSTYPPSATWEVAMSPALWNVLRNMLDDIRDGMRLCLNGRWHTVALDGNIREQDVTDCANLGPFEYASNIWIMPAMGDESPLGFGDQHEHEGTEPIRLRPQRRMSLRCDVSTFGDRFNQERMMDGKDSLPPEQIAALNQAAAETASWVRENSNWLVPSLQGLAAFVNDVREAEQHAQEHTRLRPRRP